MAWHFELSYHARVMSSSAHESPDPETLVRTREELEQLLIVGLESGEPRAMGEDDWEVLRRRALAGAEIRKRG